MTRLRQLFMCLAIFGSTACGDLFGPGQVQIEGAPSITLNPYGNAPLSAELRLQTSGPSIATIRLIGDEASNLTSETAKKRHAIPVLGLFPGEENFVEVRVSDGTETILVDTLSVLTDPLPDFLPTITILQRVPGRMEPGWTLSTLAIRDEEGSWRNVPFVFDGQGRLRWYAEQTGGGGLTFPVEPLRNGNLLSGVGPKIFETNWLGERVNEWQLSGHTFHHDVIEKPDGNFLVAVNKIGLETIEDFIIEIDRTSGDVVREIDLRRVLDIDRRLVGGDDKDWLHMNSLWFDARDGGIVLSGLFQGVVKVSVDDGVDWILAPHAGWGRAGLSGESFETSEKLLTATPGGGLPFPDAVQEGFERGANFDWPWYQHGAMLTPEGRLLLFDNGVNRNFQDALQFSRGVEYAIDEEAMTVTQTWSYGEERGAEYQSRFISDVDYLPSTGNRLVMPGRTPVGAFVTEVTEEGSVVFDAQINLLPRQIVYRSERIQLRR